MSNDNVVSLPFDPHQIPRKSLAQRELYREACELCLALFQQHKDEGTLAPVWLHQFAGGLREMRKEFNRGSRN